MKTVILCAGQSKRLKPISDKSLLSFNGKPSLVHKLESLSLEGLSDFIIIVGEHNIKSIKSTLQSTNFTYDIVVQENLDEGMAGAMKSLAKHLNDNLNEPLLVVSNNDTVNQSLIKSLAESIENNPTQSLIVGKKVDQYFPGGYIEHDKDQFLTNIIEKPPVGTEPSDMINLVYHYYSNPEALFQTLNTTISDKDDIYEVSLLKLVQQGHKFKILPYAGAWIPIKTPTHIIETARHYAKLQYAQAIHPTANVHSTATIIGEVIIDEGVKVDVNAVIQGPAYIGKNTIIGVGSFVRDSFIGSNCVIGYASEVARSYIGNNTWLHHNYIGDSIIGSNVSFGSGSITGNLRLDEEIINENTNKLGIITGDNIRVGIGVNFMPGTMVGSNTMISAGITIAEHIPADSFIKGDYTISIKKNLKDISPRN